MRFAATSDCYRCNRKVEIISIADGIWGYSAAATDAIPCIHSYCILSCDRCVYVFFVVVALVQPAVSLKSKSKTISFDFYFFNFVFRSPHNFTVLVALFYSMGHQVSSLSLFLLPNDFVAFSLSCMLIWMGIRIQKISIHSGIDRCSKFSNIFHDALRYFDDIGNIEMNDQRYNPMNMCVILYFLAVSKTACFCWWKSDNESTNNYSVYFSLSEQSCHHH